MSVEKVLREQAQIAARDGTRFAFTLSGPEDETRRLVLVHSLAMDRSFWRPVADRLTNDTAVLTYDCRGHGASDKPAGPYTVELFADDLTDLLDAIGWKSAVIAGASMGGSVALAFAGRYPKRTRALGLFDTTSWYGPDAPAQWAERAQKATTEGLKALVGFQTTRWFGDAFRERHPRIVADSVAVFLNNDLSAYAEACRMLGNLDLRDTLPCITAPTAIAVGEEDYATPIAMARALHDSIPHSKLSIIAGGRHLTPLEKPDTIAAELAGLIEAAS
jgi:3-oxoadipate enol-lactonase